MALTVPETEGPRSKRARILTAAIDSFGQDGYEHTKSAKVADEVGIGQTALYHYFESKAHCLLTIMSMELTPLARAVPRGHGGCPGSARGARGGDRSGVRRDPA